MGPLSQSFSPAGIEVRHKTGLVEYFAPTADTDAARGVALAAAWAAVVAGDTVTLSPGNYYVAKTASTVDGLPVQFAFAASVVLFLNGARLYHTASENAWTMFHARSADDWSIIGPGVIEGSGFGTGAAEVALNTSLCRRYYINKVTFRFFKGTGLVLNSSLYSGFKFPVGTVSDCVFDSNNVGMFIAPEYVTINSCQFSNNNTGIDLYGANARFTNCNVSANVVFGMKINFSTNNGHGTFVGGAFNHNTGTALWVQSTVVMGFTFVGTHFYADSTTTNYLELNGSNIRFIGGNLDAPVTATATPTNANIFDNMWIAGSNVSLSGLSTAERAMTKFLNCTDVNGAWANNDVNSAPGGTFTLVAGTVTKADTRITANSTVIPTLKTAGGTRAGLPDIVPTAGTGFTATGGGSDTSTYNYVIIN